ncbi:MAG: BolA family transcriptional regulator [Micavibrio sp.]|nr:MAG: BolA family transcriptional regulator [Micavibrio sp.]
MGPVGRKIKEKLEAAFSPLHLEIRDDSEKHRGHAGYDPRGESHFHITVVSKNFDSKSRIERQRMIHKTIADEINTRIHAVSLSLHTPEEYSAEE